jgi:hypothetical protein
MDSILDQIQNAIIEIQQPRSKFQIEKFVLGQHPTKEMQYFQVCLELQDALFNYQNAEIQLKINAKKIEKLQSSGKEIDALKAQQIQLSSNQTKTVMAGAQKELSYLIELWESFDKKFTRDEIESAQGDYWEARLVNNAKAMIMGGSGVNPSHIEAMAQAGVLEKFVEQTRIEAERDLRNLES